MFKKDLDITILEDQKGLPQPGYIHFVLEANSEAHRSHSPKGYVVFPNHFRYSVLNAKLSLPSTRCRTTSPNRILLSSFEPTLAFQNFRVQGYVVFPNHFQDSVPSLYINVKVFPLKKIKRKKKNLCHLWSSCTLVTCVFAPLCQNISLKLGNKQHTKPWRS